MFYSELVLTNNIDTIIISKWINILRLKEKKRICTAVILHFTCSQEYMSIP